MSLSLPSPIGIVFASARVGFGFAGRQAPLPNLLERIHAIAIAIAALKLMCTTKSTAGRVISKFRTQKKISVTFIPWVITGTATAVRPSLIAERRASTSPSVDCGGTCV